MKLVISDSHEGLIAAIEATLPGAAWQRCRTHFMRNVLCRVPKSAQPFVATLVRTIFAQPSAEEVAAQLARVVEQLQDRFPDVAAMLEDAAADITAFATFPLCHWRQIWSNNPQRRLNRPSVGCGHEGTHLPQLEDRVHTVWGEALGGPQGSQGCTDAGERPQIGMGLHVRGFCRIRPLRQPQVR